MSAIREAEDADESAVYSLAVAFASPTGIERAAFHATWKRKIKSADCFVGLAEVEGTVVGYISGYIHTTLYADKPMAWIDDVFVRQDVRNHGIGRSLMTAVARWAVERGCRLIALASREGAGFYRALDYEEDASRYYKRDLSK
jgi:GNAT superfamily N-acetyltransferase